MLAVALVTRVRPRQLWLGVTVLVNLGIIATWVVSRTTGVPGSEAESVAFPDVTATVLEAVAVLAALAVLSGLPADRALRGRGGIGFVGIATLATIGLVSMAVSPSFAGGHSHGETGAARGHDDATAVDPEEWTQIRYDALSGYATPEQIEQVEAAEAEYLGDQIRQRSDLLRTLPEDEVDARQARRARQAMGEPGVASGGSSSRRTVPSSAIAPRTRNSLTNPAIRLRPRLTAPATSRSLSSSAA